MSKMWFSFDNFGKGNCWIYRDKSRLLGKSDDWYIFCVKLIFYDGMMMMKILFIKNLCLFSEWVIF